MRQNWERTGDRMDVAGVGGYGNDGSIHPTQMFGGTRNAQFHGEIRLMSAVLLEAIHSFCSTVDGRDAWSIKDHREAKNWIYSDDRSWCFSFINICDSLGVSSEWLRERLGHWEMTRLRQRIRTKWEPQPTVLAVRSTRGPTRRRISFNH
jgi:hypothetical protein